MVLEIADIRIRPGEEQGFTQAYRVARVLVTATPGCRTVRMTSSIESPERFVLLVEWDSVEAHERNFRATERFTQWRAAIGPYFTAPPHVEHFVDIDSEMPPA